jgi:UDP-3-O-[3-hydroxymyristoyl] glucosamine N-acyltransferase
MPTVGALAAIVGGTVLGDAEREISAIADLATAGPDHLSFLTNPKYRHLFAETRAGAVLVAAPIADARSTLIVCQNPYLALAQIAVRLYPQRTYAPGVEPGAHVDPSAEVDATATVRAGAVVDARARIGARTLVGPNCYVGPEARLGQDVLLHAGAKVLERSVIGDRVILQAGAVIGSDGFGYAPDARGRRTKIPQVGIVVLEDDVEIGANTTVDRAAFGETRIGRGTKIDNLVQIAHNVAIGQDCVIVSQSGIAGSARLGSRVIMGAQGGVVGHVAIADDVMLGARSGVAGDIATAGVYSGTPTLPHRQWLKVAVAQQTVPELRRRVRELEQRLQAVEAGSED